MCEGQNKAQQLQAFAKQLQIVGNVRARTFLKSHNNIDIINIVLYNDV